jgi:hypothetical protein
VRHLGGQAHGSDRGEVRTAAHLAQHDRLVHGRRGNIVGHRLGPDTRKQGERRALDVGDHGGSGLDVGVEAGDRAELPPSVFVGADEVLAGCVARCHHLPGAVPDAVDDRRVEVAERAAHHVGLDVTEHAAATQSVEAETVETELFAPRQRLGGEVERGADVARLLGDRVGGVDGLHRRILMTLCEQRRVGRA